MRSRVRADWTRILAVLRGWPCSSWTARARSMKVTASSLWPVARATREAFQLAATMERGVPRVSAALSSSAANCLARSMSPRS